MVLSIRFKIVCVLSIKSKPSKIDEHKLSITTTASYAINNNNNYNNNIYLIKYNEPKPNN